MWELLSKEDQLAWLSSVSGIQCSTFDFYAIHLVELGLSQENAARYVDYLTGAVSDIAYKKVPPHQDTNGMNYYFTLITIGAEIKAKMLWHVLRGVEL